MSSTLMMIPVDRKHPWLEDVKSSSCQELWKNLQTSQSSDGMITTVVSWCSKAWKRWFNLMFTSFKIQLLGFYKNPDNTVDGSEIPSNHLLDGAKTLKILGFQLPSSTGDRRISEPSTVLSGWIGTFRWLQKVATRRVGWGDVPTESTKLFIASAQIIY